MVKRMATLVSSAFLCLTQLLWMCNSENINHTRALHTKLLKNYNSDVRPVVDQRTTVSVDMSMDLLTISSLNEVTGTFTFIGMLLFEWQDESITWNPPEHGGAVEVSISRDKVWVPDLVLLSAADEIRFVGKTEIDVYKVNYDYEGWASFWPFERIESSCPVNVRNYPFDVQTCTVVFTTLGSLPSQLKISPANDTMNLKYYRGNAVWELVSTRIYTDEELLLLKFELKRKSEFIVINVLLPISLLGLLNVLVFLLVPESGERISYCITVLLAISVFMTIISDTLPKSSDPVPIISYKLMADVLISMLIATVTILNLRFHHKDQQKQVPSFLKSLYRCCCCRSCKGREYVHKKEYDDPRTSHAPDGLRPPYIPRPDGSRPPSVARPYQRHGYPSEHMTRSHGAGPRVYEEDILEEEKEVTWKHIATMIDMFAFVFFTIAIVTSFIVFILYTTNAK